MTSERHSNSRKFQTDLVILQLITAQYRIDNNLFMFAQVYSEKLKKLVAKSLSDVIRFSSNGEMRKSCFNSLRVNTSYDAEEKLKRLLLNMNQKQLIDDIKIINIPNKKLKVEDGKMWMQDILKDLDDWNQKQLTIFLIYDRHTQAKKYNIYSLFSSASSRAE